MGLRNVVLPTYTVSVGGEDVTVRGVSVADLGTLLAHYGPSLSEAFLRITDAAKSDPNLDVQNIALSMLREFPDLIGGLIAMAADDFSPETVEIAKALDIATQVELVDNIFQLTFRSEGDVEKLLGTLTRVAERVADLTSKTNPDSQSGIGVSEDT